MHKRLNVFLEKKQVYYNFQFVGLDQAFLPTTLSYPLLKASNLI